jgi:hypothetical protein
MIQNEFFIITKISFGRDQIQVTSIDSAKGYINNGDLSPNQFQKN